MAGDRIGHLGRSTVEYVELLFGARRVGAVIVPLNWRLAPIELRSVVADCTPVLTFVTAELERTLRDAGVAAGAMVVLDDPEHPWAARISALPPTLDDRSSVPADEVALLLYTSGTTGLPKGVMLTEANFSTTGAMGRAMGFDESTVNVVVSPLFHIGGTGWGLGSMWSGGHTVLVDDASPAAILDAIERHRATDVFVVPTVLRELVERAEEHERPDSLRTIHYGASPIDAALVRRALATFGAGVAQLYGMTESTGGLARLAPEDHVGAASASARGAAGRAFPFVELRVVDPATGADRPAGEVGEICVRSIQTMAGYWDNPEATAAAFIEDGWLRTGDAGFLDADGFVHVCDRIKDMIITGGGERVRRRGRVRPVRPPRRRRGRGDRRPPRTLG